MGGMSYIESVGSLSSRSHGRKRPNRDKVIMELKIMREGSPSRNKNEILPDDVAIRS